ncbi:flagellar assembly peptidoglycan hydrolase FlgJ [Colwellia sp. E2M01]|uniref:flagellar assembly peptidoglycan hydrolase FlgJ n=1 Tax=Colwellia sp. E2M01 TaxID=2841561 RepID=UPI001C09A132|nr:flagellar assembly peptidoglycan hydrolase FlgJ [Colwellia sp. E2M01]MBU2869982.1 flagellar assembly peptidoglycan hydrolase FlgJ [Colwellia sp. E2M01]
MDINSSQKQNFDQARNALDLNGLNDIRQQSRSGDGESKKEALTEAAQQFEAIFMRMLLSSMRKAQEVLESDSPFNSQSTKFYRDMHDQQMAVELSSNGSLGLTDLIVRQLGGDDGSYKPSSVLRNDGNLPAGVNVNSVSNTNDEDEVVSSHSQKNAARENSLIEKMLAEQNKQQSGVEIPLATNSTIAAGMSNQTLASQLNSAMNQFIQTEQTKGTTKKLSADPSNDQSVNNSAPLSEQHFNEPKDFVTALIEPAQKVQEELGVPFAVVIAQAALETGWGQKIIKHQNGESSNNLFNIKADSRWAGDKITKDTLEFEEGAMVKKAEPFRTYQTLADSINDYINFLSTSERYEEALQNSSNVEHFLQGLQKAGYATDPQYAEKIQSTLKTVTNLLTK